MTISFPDKACAGTCTWKAYFYWSNNSKQKNEWKAFDMTSLQFR